MKEKIALIAPTLSHGGAERVVANLSKALLKHNRDSVTIIYHNTKSTYDHGGKLINLDIAQSDHVTGKLLNLVRKVIRLKRLKKEYQFEKTISFMDNPNFVNILSKIRGDRVFVSIRNHPSKEFKGHLGTLHKIAVRYFYSKANKIIAISQGVKQDLIDNFGVADEKIEVIYNPIDLQMINELKNENLDNEYSDIFNSPTVITIGRINNQKGQWHLIRAFKYVVERIPDAKLVILGKGEFEDYLNKLIVDCGLQDNVHILGFKDNPYKYIYNSDLFILPSLFEGFGNVIIEAMACGKPVISTDCKSGPREILAPASNFNDSVDDLSIEEYGVLIPVPDGTKYDSVAPMTLEEKFISESIVLLLENKQLSKSLSEKGLKRVQDFSFDNITKQWLNL